MQNSLVTESKGYPSKQDARFLNPFWQENLGLLCCPECRAELRATDTRLACCSCGATWPVREGIPHFLRTPSRQSTFYDQEYWGTRSVAAQTPLDQFYSRVVADWLDLLGVDPGSTYLDLSCGEGHALQAARSRGAVAVGLEISQRALSACQAKFGLPGLLLTDVGNLPFNPGTFNRISCLGSLEHYPDAEGACAEMRRIAAENCRFLFVVPNANHTFLPLLRQVDPQQLITVYDLNGWKDFLVRAGFRILRTGPDNHTYYRPIYPWRLRQVVRRSLAPLVELCGPTRAWQYFFLCEKA